MGKKAKATSAHGNTLRHISMDLVGVVTGNKLLAEAKERKKKH